MTTAEAIATPTAKSAKTNAAPGHMQTLSPHLICDGAADAIAFYKAAFGAEEMTRLPGKNGKLMHACIKVCGSSVMLVDEMPECGALSPKSLKGTPVSIHLYVDDVDAFVARAVKAGAKVTMPVADMFWGDRFGMIEDPFGHRWSVATHQRDMTAEEICAAANCAMA
jgi:PhnB protein